jgi:hypothetical protein
MCCLEFNNLAEIYFNRMTSINYFCSTRMIEVQTKLSFRILNLSGVSDNIQSNIMINLGCGAGLIENLNPFRKNFLIGIDISFFMIRIYSKRNTMADSLLIDIEKTFLPFRINTIDLCISVSCIQWIANLETSGYFNNSSNNFKKYFSIKFVRNLCIMQFYPKSLINLKTILDIFVEKQKKKYLIIDKKSKNTSQKYFIFCKI